MLVEFVIMKLEIFEFFGLEISGREMAGGTLSMQEGLGFEECLCLGRAAQTPLDAWGSEM